MFFFQYFEEHLTVKFVKVKHGSYKTRFATQIKKFIDGWDQNKINVRRCLEKIEHYKPNEDDTEEEALSNEKNRKHYEDALSGCKSDLLSIAVEGDLIKEGLMAIINGNADGGQEDQGRRKSSVEDEGLNEMIQESVDKAIKKFVDEEVMNVIQIETEKLVNEKGKMLIELVQEYVKKNLPLDLVSRITLLEDMNER